MFSHTTIGTSYLARAIAFYDAALAPLLIERFPSKYPGWAVRQRPGEPQRFRVGQPYNRQPATVGNGCMTAFTAPLRAAVDSAYAAAIAAGGTDEGPPGLRPNFALDYYGVYVRDPDVSKLCFVRLDSVAQDSQ